MSKLAAFLKYRRLENLMTYLFSHAMLCINKRQLGNGQKAVSSPTKATSESQRSITLTVLATMAYGALLFNHIQPELRKFFGKIRMAFKEIIPFLSLRVFGLLSLFLLLFS